MRQDQSFQLTVSSIRETVIAELDKDQRTILDLIRRRTENGLPTSWSDVGGHCGRAGFWCKKPDQCDFYVEPDRTPIRRILKRLEALGLICQRGRTPGGDFEWFAT